MDNRFYKVKQEGGTFIVATFFNPITKEVKTECVRDYDYADGSRDNDELYYMPIDEMVERIFKRDILGLIQIGDRVEVVKGRKLPIGTIGTVAKVYDWRDRYGRKQATYAVLEDGQKTNVNNLRIIKEES